MSDPVVREFLLTFWKIHILHHAGEDGVYGQWMLEELRRHGHSLSPGTLYPLLSRMARHGWLRSSAPQDGASKAPRMYHLTAAGRRVLKTLRVSLDELYREVGATGDSRVATRPRPRTSTGRAARR